jgi:acetolactate synthase-1/2/3 large subunit
LSGANAGGLGTGLGEALGAKLAAPDRQVIAVVGDGSYMFGNPTAAHFVGRSANLPTLTMVMNNSMWFAVRRATLAMYPDGEASKANTMPLTELTPPPDYEKTIEACGGRGERVEDPQALIPALERALNDVGDGQQVLLNVVTQPGGRD